MTQLPSSCLEVGEASPKIPKIIPAIVATLSCILEWTLVLNKKYTLVTGLEKMKLVLLEAYSLLSTSQYQKIVGRLPRRKSHQQAYLAVSPVTYNSNWSYKICLLEQYGHVMGVA